jgi:hypothetical protein
MPCEVPSTFYASALVGALRHLSLTCPGSCPLWEWDLTECMIEVNSSYRVQVWTVTFPMLTLECKWFELCVIYLSLVNRNEGFLHYLLSNLGAMWVWWSECTFKFSTYNITISHYKCTFVYKVGSSSQFGRNPSLFFTTLQETNVWSWPTYICWRVKRNFVWNHHTKAFTLNILTNSINLVSLYQLVGEPPYKTCSITRVTTATQ